MKFEDTVRSLRSVREYSDEPISRIDLRWLVDLAHLAPSARNGQPWRFVVTTARPRLVELATVGRGGAGAAHLAGAAAAVALSAAIPAEEDRDSLLFDLGQAAYGLQLAAVDAGIGSCLAKVVDQETTRRVLRLNTDQFCPYILALGKPAHGLGFAPIERPARLALDAVARFMPV